ncbi:hypothetical protein A2U01_0046059, partial [Trifolium medium]|nr:hypothetical protein [Trifolium medium]
MDNSGLQMRLHKMKA